MLKSLNEMERGMTAARTCYAQLRALAAALIGCVVLTGCSSMGTVLVALPAETPAGTFAASVQAESRTAAAASPHQGAFDEAISLMREQDWPRAETAWRTLAAAAPHLHSVQTNLGITLMRQGRDEEAREIFAATLALRDDCTAWNWLGVVERRAGNLAASEAAYRACISHQPDYAPAHRNLGVLQEIYLGKLAEARKSYARYQKLLGTGDPTVGLWLSDLERRLGPDTQFAVSE